MTRWLAIWGAALVAANPAVAAEFVVGVGAIFDVGSGALDLGCADLGVNGSYLAGTGTTSGVRDVSIAPTGALEGEAGALELAGGWDNTGSFVAGSSSVSFVDGCGLSSASVFGDTSFATLAIVTAAGKTLAFAGGSTQTIANSLTLDGGPGAPLVLRSTDPGMQAFFDLLGMQVIDGVDVEDVHGAGLALLVDPASVLGNNTLGWAFVGAVPSLGVFGLLATAVLLLRFGARRSRSAPVDVHRRAKLEVR